MTSSTLTVNFLSNRNIGRISFLVVLAERHGGPFKHRGRAVEAGRLANALLRDQTSLSKFDFPVVSETRVPDQPELLVERSTAPRRRRIVQGATGRHQGKAVSVDDPRDPVPGQVGVEGELVSLHDIFESR